MENATLIVLLAVGLACCGLAHLGVGDANVHRILGAVALVIGIIVAVVVLVR